MRRGMGLWLGLALGLGLAFLYGPIVTLVAYSFNASRSIAVWAGFSTRWYAALLDNQQILDAAWLSVRVAALSATLAVGLGTLAALALVRFGPFRGRTLFASLIAVPLVLPEVILGLALLLLFVTLADAVGWPAERGALTIVIAHVTLGLAYVTVIVQARLRGVDRTLEDAAMDLGAGPVRTFFAITVPAIAPALVAGWLLAFTLSLDDLVVASFVSGPGATTLPMVVYSSVRLGVSPEINALATLMVVAVGAIVGLAALLLARAEARRG